MRIYFPEISGLPLFLKILYNRGRVRCDVSLLYSVLACDGILWYAVSCYVVLCNAA